MQLYDNYIILRNNYRFGAPANDVVNKTLMQALSGMEKVPERLIQS